VVGWPSLLDDVHAIAERDLGVGPAFDGGREGRLRGQEVVHEVLVKGKRCLSPILQRAA
jgi:hypothetical protein